jgi:hypothetical protein
LKELFFIERRRVEVGVIIVVIGVGVGVVLLVLVVLLLLWVLLLGAPRRTTIKRHLVIGGDVFLGGMVGWQVVLAGRQAA